jgi:hypothetical protein
MVHPAQLWARQWRRSWSCSEDSIRCVQLVFPKAMVPARHHAEEQSYRPSSVSTCSAAAAARIASWNDLTVMMTGRICGCGSGSGCEAAGIHQTLPCSPVCRGSLLRQSYHSWSGKPSTSPMPAGRLHSIGGRVVPCRWPRKMLTVEGVVSRQGTPAGARWDGVVPFKPCRIRSLVAGGSETMRRGQPGE